MSQNWVCIKKLYKNKDKWVYSPLKSGPPKNRLYHMSKWLCNISGKLVASIKRNLYQNFRPRSTYLGTSETDFLWRLREFYQHCKKIFKIWLKSLKLLWARNYCKNLCATYVFGLKNLNQMYLIWNINLHIMADFGNKKFPGSVDIAEEPKFINFWNFPKFTFPCFNFEKILMPQQLF